MENIYCSAAYDSLGEWLFARFLACDDTLRVYKGSRWLFRSDFGGVEPLIEFIRRFPGQDGIIVFDKVMGNAAALLAIRAGCREVFSPLGSRPAIETLNRYNIEYHITRIVPYILRADNGEMCPMERLSLGREPETFYEIMKDRRRAGAPAGV
jgi:hypothetical protein